MENLEVAKARELILKAASGYCDIDDAIDLFVLEMDKVRSRKINYMREQVGKAIRNIEMHRLEIAIVACKVVDDNLKKL